MCGVYSFILHAVNPSISRLLHIQSLTKASSFPETLIPIIFFRLVRVDCGGQGSGYFKIISGKVKNPLQIRIHFKQLPPYRCYKR